MLFRKFLNDPNRPAARKLSDIVLDGDSFKPDFEIAERYTSFATEIIRLSLIGIGVYGFIIVQIVMKQTITDDKIPKLIYTFHDTIWVPIIGIFFLILALAFSLYHRFCSCNCLYDQILILRSLLRQDQGHWTEGEKEDESKFLERTRERQRKESKFYHHILMWSSIFLFIGFLFIAIDFLLIIAKIGQ